jgi:hypothetical protein
MNGHFIEARTVDGCNITCAAMTLDEFCADVDTPKKLKSDEAPKTIGQNNEFYVLARSWLIDFSI